MLKTAWIPCAVALTLFAMGNARSDDLAGPTLVRLQAGIEVDASGQVVAVEMDPDSTLPQVLQDRTRDVVKRWRFKPIMHEGRAVGGKTWANVNLCLAPVADDGINVAVAFSSNGPGEVADQRVRSVPPLPPGIFAEVSNGGLKFESRLRYRVDADGHPELLEAELLDHNLQRRYGRGWRREITKWLSRRRFKPEILDGEPIATVMELPMTVELSMSSSQSAVEAKHRELQANTDVCRAAAGKPDNEAMAIDSRFELLPQG